MKNKHIVIFSYYFPPYGNVASRRPYYLAKHLRKNGFKVSIVTSLFKGSQKEWDINCSNDDIYRFPVNKIPKSFNRIQTIILKMILNLSSKIGRGNEKILNTLGFFLLPLNYERRLDVEISDLSEKLVDVDYVLATGDPWQMLEYGKKFSKLIGKPFFVDYRDPWTLSKNSLVGARNLTFYGRGKIGRVKHWYIQRIEKKILNSCKGAFVVSEGLADNLSKIDSKLKVVVLPNGYDYLSSSGNISYSNDIMEILFVGTLYNDQIEMFNMLCQTISELISSYSELKSNIKIKFVGNLEKYPSKVLGLVKGNSDLLEYFEFIDFMPKHELNKLKQSASIYLNLGYDRTGILPVKTFEYIENGKPILVVSKYRNIMEHEIDQLNAGTICGNVDELVNFILSSFENWKIKALKSPKYNLNYLKSYSFESIIDKLINELENSDHE